MSILAFLCCLATFFTLVAQGNRTQVWCFARIPWLFTVEKFLHSQPPEAVLWRVTRGAEDVKDMAAFSVEKLIWSVLLLSNFRGIGWNWEVKNIARQDDSHPRIFATKRACRTFILLFLFDFLQHVANKLMSPTTGTIRHEHWMRDFTHILCFCLLTIVQLDLIYSATSAISVACGFANPKVTLLSNPSFHTWGQGCC